MADIRPGETWEVYSDAESRWVRVVVTKIEGTQVTLRYEGLLEFLTVDLSDIESKPDAFRRADVDSSSS